MSEFEIQDAEGPCSCDNCDWKGDASDLEIICDIQERINAGATVPAGECPACGALAYLDIAPVGSTEWRLQREIAALKAQISTKIESKPPAPAPALLAALKMAQATIERLDAKAKATSAMGTLDVIRATIATAERNTP